MAASLPDTGARPAHPSRVAPVAGAPLQVRAVYGRRHAFRLLGSGPPLVLLHDIGDSSATWNPALPALARRHLVIAPDLPGHGLSDAAHHGSVTELATSVRDLLDLLEVPHATVVGHSLGGTVARRLAEHFPERVHRLVLTGSAATVPTPALRALTLPGAAAVLRLLQHPTVRLHAGAVAALLRVCGNRFGHDAAGLLRMIDDRPDAGEITSALRCALTPTTDEPAAPADMPTLLLWGEHDTVVPLEHARRLHAAMPGSHVAVIDGAGHYPFQTDPQAFVSTLTAFLGVTTPVRTRRRAARSTAR